MLSFILTGLNVGFARIYFSLTLSLRDPEQVSLVPVHGLAGALEEITAYSSGGSLLKSLFISPAFHHLFSAQPPRALTLYTQWELVMKKGVPSMHPWGSLSVPYTPKPSCLGISYVFPIYLQATCAITILSRQC